MASKEPTLTPPPEDLPGLDVEEDVEVPMDPLIKLLHKRYAYNATFTTSEEKAKAKEEIMAEIKAGSMAPYYNLMCELFGWAQDAALMTSMKEANAAKLKELDEKIQYCKDNNGDSEVRDALIAKCNHFARIGDLQNCLALNEELSTSAYSVGPRLDMCFMRIRLGIAFSDNDIAAKGILDAHKLMKDADWERRNRMKVYEGLYCLCIRNFEKGAQLLIDALSTFACTELLDFTQFIALATIGGLVTLSRSDLKQKIVDSPEVLSAGLLDYQELVNSIYQCRYKDVFPALDRICTELRRSVFLSVHVNYIFREIRVLVFNQFLDSYSSVTLQSMANSFGLSVTVLDQMLSTFISNERVAGKIDRVSGSITTYRGDNINFQYHRILKNGDVLLNRVQKLSRLVEMYSGESTAPAAAPATAAIVAATSAASAADKK